MLIKFSDICRNYDKKITGVVHLGAHIGEELEDYYNNGIRYTIWVEADPNVCEKLGERLQEFANTHEDLEFVACNDLVLDVDGDTVKFNIANNNQSSSVLEFGLHAVHAPEVQFVGSVNIDCKRFDTIFKSLSEYFTENKIDPKIYNFLNLDLQGVELLALKGCGDLLDQFDYIYTEINIAEVYKGNATLDELDGFLNKRGFMRIDTAMTDRKWGDALYVRF